MAENYQIMKLEVKILVSGQVLITLILSKQ